MKDTNGIEIGDYVYIEKARFVEVDQAKPFLELRYACGLFLAFKNKENLSLLSKIIDLNTIPRDVIMPYIQLRHYMRETALFQLLGENFFISHLPMKRLFL